MYGIIKVASLAAVVSNYFTCCYPNRKIRLMYEISRAVGFVRNFIACTRPSGHKLDVSGARSSSGYLGSNAVSPEAVGSVLPSTV